MQPEREHVRPPAKRLTDADARRLLSAGLIRTCHEMRGPSRVALEIGCDEKTVRRARDEESTLSLASALNLIGLPGNALDEALAERGVRVVPLGARCDTDALLTTSAAIHRIAEARSPFSPGGASETEAELLAMEREVDAALESLDAMKARIIGIRQKRAAA